LELRKRVTQWVSVGVLAALPFSLSGCYDRQELEQQAFVSEVGFDAAPGGLLDCTFHIALPVNPSGGGGEGKSGSTPLAGKGNITFRAHSINEAMLLANSSIERQMSFSHLGEIFFGESLAKQGILPYLQPLVRFREFRRTVIVVVAKGSAREEMAAISPVLEQSTTRMADSMSEVGDKTGLIPVAHVHELTISVENPHQDIAMPLISINQAVLKDPSGKNGITEKGLSYQSGDVRRAGGDPVEWMGAAVFRGEKMVDELSGRQTMDLNLLRGKLRNGKMDFQDPARPKNDLGVTLHRERKPMYTLQLGNPLKIKVEVPVDMDVINISSGADYTSSVMQKKLEQSISQQLSNELQATLTHLMHDDDSDPIPVSNYVRGQFATYQAYANYPWQNQIKTAQITVKATAHIRRYGVQMQPLKPET
jgi:spore germination protein KC